MNVSEKNKTKVSAIEVNRKELEENRTPLDVLPLDISTGPRFGCRHVQAALLCLGLMCGIGTRSSLSVAIVAMTDNTTSPNPDVPAYDWKNTSVILSAFYWSFITFQILAGYLGKTYGPKYFLLVAFFINCCACAFIPLAASTMGSGGVILCRIVQGLSQGFLHPSCHVMLGTWVPFQERTTLMSFVFAGAATGSMLSSILTGFIATSWWGWPSSFYILAIMGFLWCILWAVFAQNSPATHPRITVEEKRYIQSSLKQEGNEHLPIPWKKILTCVPFYAIMAALIGNTWGFAILATEIPTYLANVMKFDLKSSALINSLPTLVGLASSLTLGPLSDWIISNQYLSTWNARRTFHTIGTFGQALCVLWLSFLTESQASTSIIVLALANSLTACVLVGSHVSHLDLSPRFGGILFGILSAASEPAAIMAPLVAQFVVTDLTNVSQWKIVFLSAVGFYVLGAIVFMFLGSATRQSWDGPEDKGLEGRRKKISVISLSEM